jgi:hypothetical protein
VAIVVFFEVLWLGPMSCVAGRFRKAVLAAAAAKAGYSALRLCSSTFEAAAFVRLFFNRFSFLRRSHSLSMLYAWQLDRMQMDEDPKDRKSRDVEDSGRERSKK